jgi:quercetin dioxygenase-like cupin family protein
MGGLSTSHRVDKPRMVKVPNGQGRSDSEDCVLSKCVRVSLLIAMAVILSVAVQYPVRAGQRQNNEMYKNMPAAPSPGAPGTYWTNADLMDGVKKAMESSRSTIGDYEFAHTDEYWFDMMERRPPTGAISHPGTEVYYVTAGSGTLVTGGELVPPPQARGLWEIKGGVSRHVAPGDVVVVPSNSPHWFKDIDGAAINWVEIRFAPGKFPKNSDMYKNMPAAPSERSAGTYWASADLMAGLKKQVDRSPNLADHEFARTDEYWFDMLQRGSGSDALKHVGTEVHYITAGSGTLVTGGELDPPDGTAAPRGRRREIKGGDSRQVAKGDVIVVPSNSPQWYKGVDGASISYFAVRFPAAKYVTQ